MIFVVLVLHVIPLYNLIMNLAFNLRPRNLDEYIGQEHLVGEGKIIRRMIENNALSSMIFWGPPGSGKTSLAQVISEAVEGD